jgi:serine/threonine protein kinase
MISQSVKAFSLYGEKLFINSNKLENYSALSMKSFLEKYRIIEKIYSNFSAPSHILLLEDTEGVKYAAKQTIKKRLTGDYYHEFVKNEMLIQHSLSRFSRNIVKVLDYYEDEDTYLMVMEYSYQPNYFEDLLENVKSFLIISNTKQFQKKEF